MYLVQDIETIPTALPELYEDYKFKALKKDPKNTDPFPPIWAHRVISIGMLQLDRNFHPTTGGLAAGGLSHKFHPPTEEQMVLAWADTCENLKDPNRPLQMVDWNGKAFDVPVLQTRAMHHGIPLPWYFQSSDVKPNKWSKAYRDRYGGKHIDLADDWTNHRAFAKPSLLHLSSLLGLPGKVGIDGSKVFEAYQQGRLEEIDIYCMQDVIQTAFIFQRFAYLKGRLTLTKYRSAAQSLLDFTTLIPEQQEFISTIDTRSLLLQD